MTKIRNKIGNVKVIIIDEISTIDLALFVGLDRILRASFDQEKPFGGKSIILLGDFCQLPPNAGVSVAEALVGFSALGQEICGKPK